MNKNRRDFLMLAGVAGLDAIGAGLACSILAGQSLLSKTHRQRFNMHGYAASPLDTVRTGFFGIGRRGSGTVSRMAAIEGVDVKALCDLNPEKMSAAIDSIQEYPHHKPDSYSGGEDEWKKVCDRHDIDLNVIVTPWNLHNKFSGLCHGA